MKKIEFLLSAAELALCLAVLSACGAGRRGAVSVANWNVQTFFDAEFDGNEYKEFRSAASGWTQEKYEQRLDRLAEVLKALDCDIVVLEELEKEAQLHDIFNRLSGTFDQRRVYRYGCFSAEPGASIGCGVLSRIPIDDVSSHAVHIGRGGGRQPSMRPIMRVAVRTCGAPLVLFVNHWKSKSGGAAASDFWRDAQERQLARLMRTDIDAGYAVLACGDFNRSIEEFEYAEDGTCNVRLKGGVGVHSPWYGAGGVLAGAGSYWFNDAWERIDNFFAAGGAQIADFAPRTAGAWADADGKPRRYKVYNGYGYSDHLPITCTVRLAPADGRRAPPAQ